MAWRWQTRADSISRRDYELNRLSKGSPGHRNAHRGPGRQGRRRGDPVRRQPLRRVCPGRGPQVAGEVRRQGDRWSAWGRSGRARACSRAWPWAPTRYTTCPMRPSWAAMPLPRPRPWRQPSTSWATMTPSFAASRRVDEDNAAVGIMLAELLDLPHVSVVTKPRDRRRRQVGPGRAGDRGRQRGGRDARCRRSSPPRRD